jgi:hypothetical protein
VKLTKLSYTDIFWELHDLELSTANLIVGTNSTGKSRTLLTIDLLYKMLQGRNDLNWGSRWDVHFIDDENNTLNYQFSTSTTKGREGVTREKLILNESKVVLDRHQDGSCLLIAVDGSESRPFPPSDKLTLHVRRDTKQYPFFEKIVNWAEHSYGLKFGSISANSLLKHHEFDMLNSTDFVHSHFPELSLNGQDLVKHYLNETGYSISNITHTRSDEDTILWINEEGIEKGIPHYRLSQGMLRTLMLLIFIQHLIESKKPSTVVIDDLCEGLDYSRATKIGKLVFELCKTNHIQLIATSNDSFLMDAVPIEDWNILRRTGKVVTSINARKYPDLFANFHYTGLSNFDFFSSDFIKKRISN